MAEDKSNSTVIVAIIVLVVILLLFWFFVLPKREETRILDERTIEQPTPKFLEEKAEVQEKIPAQPAPKVNSPTYLKKPTTNGQKREGGFQNQR